MALTWDGTIKISDLVIATATLVGPIAAVQAQKLVERLRERRSQKKWIFTTLMGTRGARLAAEHVRALNMIELAFTQSARFGRNKTTKREKAVLEAWRSYRTHLNTQYPQNDPNAGGVWIGTGNTLFVNLLAALAPDVGYRFQRDELASGGYTPTGHSTSDLEGQAIRRMTVETLAGTRALRVEVTQPAAAAQQPAPQPGGGAQPGGQQP